MAYELTVETTVCDTEMTKLMTSLATRNIITFANSNAQVQGFETMCFQCLVFWVVASMGGLFTFVDTCRLS